MDQEHENYADPPTHGWPWPPCHVVILGMVACLALFLVLMALEVAEGIHLGIAYAYD